MDNIMLLACASALMLTSCTSDPLAPRPTHTLTRSLNETAADRAVPSRFRDADDTSPSTLSMSEPSSPDDFVRLALYRSPELERSYQQWVAMSQRVPQAGALPDPRLNVRFFANEVETRVGAQQARIGVSQQLPWSGKLRASEVAAAAEARAAWVRYTAIERSITRRVVTALYAIHELDATIDITRESLELLSSFEDSVRSRFRVGGGSQSDLVRTQVELGMLDDRLVSLRSSRSTLVAQLNALLDRPHDTPVAPITELSPPPLDTPLDELITQTQRTNPLLVSLSERVIAEQSRTKVARYASKPELTLGVETIFTDDAINPSIAESGDDPLLLTFSVNLPIWRDKYNAQVQESIAKRLALAYERESAFNDLSARIVRSHFDYTDAQRRAKLYEHTLIPKATESIQSTLASFRTGTDGFTDLLDAQRTLLEFQLNALRARTAQGIALARLHELIGITDASVEQTKTNPISTPETDR
ncbi:MAG: TolC family protein [Phycisphaerales bacterium]|nr:TolC family protein [Phycisphaerales bacterium]